MNLNRYSKKLLFYRDQVNVHINLWNLFWVPSANRPDFSMRHQLHVRSLHLLNDDDMAKISVSEIKKNLKAHFNGYLEGHACLMIDCPSCRENKSNLASIGKMCVNVKTGYCYCTQCQLQGPWASFEAYLNSFKVSNNQQSTKGVPKLKDFLTPFTPSQVEKEEMDDIWVLANPVESMKEGEIQAVMSELNLEKVSVKTLIKAHAKINVHTNQLILPILLTSSARYQGLKVLTPQLIKDSDEDNSTNPNEVNYPKLHPWLLGYHLVKNKEDVILTSTAADTLTAMQHLSTPVLCAPKGISHLPQATLSFLEPFRKITLWLGQGMQGWESARIFAKKLGEKRCHFIRPIPDTPSPWQCQRYGVDLPRVFRTAQPVTHKSVTTFSSLRDDVYAEVIQHSTVAGVRWRRFPVLTELLKGHRRGELTVFTGPTGAGKTTFISEYSLDLCMQNVNTLWGSFEIRNVRLAKMMLQQYAEAPLTQDPQGFAALANSFEKLPMYFLTFHGQQTVKAVLDACSHAIYVHDIAHIIIDNLQFMMGTSESSSMDRFWKQDHIIGAFREFATLNNVHITIVIHPRKEGTEELSTSSIFGGAKASQEADNILILQDKRLTDPSSRRKYIQVAKNRYTGDLGMMPLEFHKESLSFAQRKKGKLVKKTLVSSPPSPSVVSSSHVRSSNLNPDHSHGSSPPESE